MRLYFLPFVVALASLETPPAGLAEEDAAKAEKPLDAGHSFHGEAFNEGPRQQAYLMGGTGNVHFACTTDNELVQQFVNQGVGQLHGYWYFEAERSFRQAAALDPDCAIAYWGMAMANVNNEKRAREFIAEAVARKSHASDREKQYVDAWNAYLTSKDKSKDKKQKYIAALEKIALAHPDDLEAKALLAHALYAHRRDVPSPSTLSIDALLKDVLATNPLHPVHHYRIHLWDNGNATRALDSAAKCGAAAPGIAHMWHMPGHTYSRLKRYEDAVWQQEASARVDHAHMIRDRVLPDQIHNFAHNNEWLIRNLLHIGRVHDAVALAKNMVELPRHPKYNRADKSGCSASYGRLRLFQALSEAEMWDELIALASTLYLEPTDIVKEQINRLRHLGRAQFRRGDAAAGERILSDLQHWQADEKRKQSAAEEAAAEKARKNGSDRAVSKARSDAAKPFAATLQALAKAVNELEGLSAVARGEHKAGLDLLKKAGGLDPLYLAVVQHLAGDKAAAEKAAAQQVQRNPHEAIPLAKLVDLRWQMGNRAGAKSAFEQLRAISGSVDLDVPVFARLAPIAEDLGFPRNWRVSKPRAKDFGERPSLESLGPFRWQPSAAESWSLPDVDGTMHSLSDYRGRPVVVIFYLGAGCLHCAEQLQAFAPKTPEFEKAGIELIAVSTDDAERLRRSHANYKDGVFPFPLVSDANLHVFKQYRCYDDFENLTLHGTFLIDGNGLVRWQDISYEPFMDVDFVLDEAERLLGQRAAEPTVITTLKPSSPAIAEKPE